MPKKSIAKHFHSLMKEMKSCTDPDCIGHIKDGDHYTDSYLKNTQQVMQDIVQACVLPALLEMLDALFLQVKELIRVIDLQNKDIENLKKGKKC